MSFGKIPATIATNIFNKYSTFISDVRTAYNKEPGVEKNNKINGVVYKTLGALVLGTTAALTISVIANPPVTLLIGAIKAVSIIGGIVLGHDLGQYGENLKIRTDETFLKPEYRFTKNTLAFRPLLRPKVLN